MIVLTFAIYLILLYNSICSLLQRVNFVLRKDYNMTFLCKHQSRLFLVCMLLVSMIVTSIPVYANDVTTLTNRSNLIRNQLADLDQQIADLAVQLIEAEDELQNISSEMITTSEDLAVAEQNQANQYDNMKTRIRFMYEAGSASMLEMLFSAESMSEFLNKAEFIQTISNYDRNMLLELVSIRQTVLDKKDQLAQQQAEQEAAIAALAERKNELEATAASTNVSLATVMNLLQQAKQQELENAANSNNNNQGNNNTAGNENNNNNNNQGGGNTGGGDSGNTDNGNQGGNNGGNNGGDTGGGNGNGGDGGTTNPPVTPPPTTDPSDQVLLAAILEAEARPNREGMLAVATVIMNRVADPRFPNTIRAVIYQPGQFSPVSSGRLQAILDRGPIPIAMSTAAEALGGARDQRVIHCFFFLAASTTNRPGINIQGNLFFERW